MSESSPAYAYEKLGNACREIGKRSRNAKRGLKAAFPHISAVQPRDFPDGDLRDRYQTIREALTADGRVNDTIDAMSDDGARDLANRIRGLDRDIGEWLKAHGS